MRRPHCPRCLRALSACLCDLTAETANEIEVLVLQHPLEQYQAKGTARLLALSLQRCSVVVGETFDPLQLQALLHAPAADGRALQPLLLYPGAAPAPAPLAGCPVAGLRLIVIDATWRKSRKMLALNPALQALPRLALAADALPPSRYRVRRAEAAAQRSTLEATLLALAQLEGQPARYAPLWAGMDGLMAQLASRLPAD